jgi:hypothetical protein
MLTYSVCAARRSVRQFWPCPAEALAYLIVFDTNLVPVVEAIPKLSWTALGWSIRVYPTRVVICPFRRILDLLHLVTSFFCSRSIAFWRVERRVIITNQCRRTKLERGVGRAKRFYFADGRNADFLGTSTTNKRLTIRSTRFRIAVCSGHLGSFSIHSVHF